MTCFTTYDGVNLEAIRVGPWKLILENGALYNLQTDIGETANVAAAQPDIVRRLTRLAERMDKDLGVTRIGPGCRPLGRVAEAEPLIDNDGRVREGFESK